MSFCPFLVGQSTSKTGQYFNYTVSNGLPTVEVYDVLQDQQGYIWLGTEAGLCRFDGYHFKTFTTKDGLPNNDVLDIVEDKEGRIWINSLGPLAYLYQDSIVKFDTNLRSIYSNFNVISGASEEYWLNYGGGVFRIDSTLELQRQQSPTDAFHPRFYYHRLFAQGDWIWVANREALFKFEGKTVIEKIPLAFSISQMDGFQVTENNGYIYYTSDAGLVVVDLQSKSRRQRVVIPDLKQANQLTVIDNEVWLVSLKEGVFQLVSGPNGDLQIGKRLLENGYPSRIIKDDEGNLWVASYGNGLYFLPINADKFKVIELPGADPNSKPQTVTVLGDTLLTGDHTGHLQYLNGERSMIATLPVEETGQFNRILEIQPLPSGAFLLGTDRGLWRWTLESSLQIHSFPIKNIFVHPEGKVLINTFRGTFASHIHFLDTLQTPLNPKVFDREGFVRIFKERAYAALIDSEGQTWLGNSWSGLTKSDGENMTYLRDWAPIFNSVVVDLQELNQGIICAATQGDGLILIKGSDFFLINEDNGLAGNICNDLLVDGQELWVATNKGISHIRSIKFEEPSFNITVFNETDGLLSKEVEAIDYRDSTLYMATAAGLMVANTCELRQSPTAPRVYITELIINETPVRLQPVQKLTSDQNNIRIRYVGLSYKSHGNVLYQYQLEGEDANWITTTALETHYSNLAPGHYRFKVAAMGNAGNESLSTQEIRFHIAPKFTQTVLFRLIVLSLLLVLLYLFYSVIHNYRQRARLERLVTEKTKALQEKYRDLAEVNTKLELSNRELQQFAHVASHDLKAPLRNVAGFVQLLDRRANHKLNEEEREYIQFAVAGVKRMDLIIQDLLSMSQIDRLEETKKPVAFDRVVEEVIQELQFQIEEKHAKVSVTGKYPVLHFNQTNAKQLLQNLITNALTYQDKERPQVEITCKSENGHWVFGVKDNGIGIAPEYQQKIFEIFQRLHPNDHFVGTGVGLAICKKIVEKNNGRIWCESVEGEGATFYFTLPNSIATY